MNFLQGITHWLPDSSSLDLSDLRHCLIGPRMSIIFTMQWNRKPSSEKVALAEKLLEGHSELSTHRTIKNEVDGRVDQGENVHQFTC